ncbi:MAG TPA: heme-dependent peroxidase [Candidatus Pseudogracilibacillus intestinigallinarum]|uniref:Coproheme decarboxylase n=1 Tax=Candidatus Pseudogracilibacillus intestinigallinarum TaxID=2838742 RepID=A0A9D1PNS1_9BACI|nr:heme-dependent peroxidase [Candidatus Pseudogracilibacillus intestinigallinarum]
MVEAVETMDGWCCLHDLRKVDWEKWKNASEKERTEALTQFHELLTEWDLVEGKKEGSHALYQAIGHKGDVLLMILRPTFAQVAEVETALNKTKLAEYLIQTHSYTSIVELAKYRPDNGVDPETLPETQARLKPILPKWEYICFYPMSRKREGDNNWYTLEKGARSKLLYEHSLTGRKYAGKVQQIITGSIGLDRFEWGVTLFAHDALQFKKIVYEMRFDEVTALYGEFEQFYIGHHLPKEQLEKFLHV